MEKEANQLYRRPQMTGQARDEEDNQLYRRPQMTGQARDEEEALLENRRTLLRNMMTTRLMTAAVAVVVNLAFSRIISLLAAYRRPTMIIL